MAKLVDAWDLKSPVRKDVPVRFRLRAPNKSRACMRFFVQALCFLFRNSESCSAIFLFCPSPGVLPKHENSRQPNHRQTPSNPFKLDLLSASKYGSPITGARCNDAQRCWIPSNHVTRKVTGGFRPFYGVLPNEHKAVFSEQAQRLQGRKMAPAGMGQ